MSAERPLDVRHRKAVDGLVWIRSKEEAEATLVVSQGSRRNVIPAVEELVASVQNRDRAAGRVIVPLEEGNGRVQSHTLFSGASPKAQVMADGGRQPHRA